MLDEFGLIPTLRWLVRTFGQRMGIEVDLVHEGMETPLDPDVGTLAFRVVQEALTNMAKHAHTPRAEVRLQRAKNRLVLQVRDHGLGFDPAPILESDEEGRGFGVRGMRERVRFFGGHFDLRSSPGAGTLVRAEVPLPPERSHP
jgi:signal transduction histidine kinase